MWSIRLRTTTCFSSRTAVEIFLSELEHLQVVYSLENDNVLFIAVRGLAKSVTEWYALSH